MILPKIPKWNFEKVKPRDWGWYFKKEQEARDRAEFERLSKKYCSACKDEQ
jgi:hypothetical protein